MSLRAAKALHLLVKAAGDRVDESLEHRIKVSELTEIAHLSIDEIIETLLEIVGTVVELRRKVGDREEVLIDPLVHSVKRPVMKDMGEAGAVICFRLSIALQNILESSAYWTVLSRKAVLAFQSRYALRMYEVLSLRTGLDHKTEETFELNDLRQRFGVPKGKLDRWQDLKRFALEPAIAEVNHLSPFTVSYEPITRRGRGRPSVTAVRISWFEKDKIGRVAALRELETASVGRKARREGTVEQIVDVEPPAKFDVFPAEGGISFSRWAEIAREELPEPTPDIDQVANAFRRWTMQKRKPRTEPVFRGFCRGWKI